MLRSLILRVSLFVAAFAVLNGTNALFHAHAEDADSQVWTQFTFNARFPNQVRLFAEVQPRRGENYSEFTQLLIRPAVGYQLTPKFSVWLGYAWTPSYFPEFTNENRTFQQLLWEDAYRGTTIINRTRLEERFIEHAGGTSYRLRHQLRLSHPLDRGKRWAIFGANELHWNLNSTPRGPESGYDQDRAHIGVFYNVSKHTRLELGYQATFVNPPRHRPDRRLDTLMITANYNL